jgi:hypothetical protein
LGVSCDPLQIPFDNRTKFSQFLSLALRPMTEVDFFVGAKSASNGVQRRYPCYFCGVPRAPLFVSASKGPARLLDNPEGLVVDVQTYVFAYHLSSIRRCGAGRRDVSPLLLRLQQRLQPCAQ